jgi:hypothetical protein
MPEPRTPPAAPQPGPPDPADADYLGRACGYPTLDDLAEAVYERLGADDEVASLAEVKRRIVAYGPDQVWATLVSPMLAKMETALGFGEDRT